MFIGFIVIFYSRFYPSFQPLLSGTKNALNYIKINMLSNMLWNIFTFCNKLPKLAKSYVSKSRISENKQNKCLILCLMLWFSKHFSQKDSPLAFLRWFIDLWHLSDMRESQTEKLWKFNHGWRIIFDEFRRKIQGEFV